MSADCLHSPDIQDNAEHTFNCDRRATKRASLVADIGRIVPDYIGAMLRGKDVSNHMAYYAEGTIRVKRGQLKRR